MFILDMSVLRVGDILLTREKKFISKGVRLFSQGDYSHAMLYVARASYIHSDRDGVHSGNIQRKLFDRADDVKVVRVNDEKYIRLACDYARNKIGTEYSIKDAIKSVLPKEDMTPSDKQFCSRLVAESYEYAGLNLVKNPKFCTPSELILSPDIHLVADFIKPATDEEVSFAKSDNPLYKQQDATNFILSEARRITGKNIQNFQDIDNALLHDDSFDSEISLIAENSGYYSFMSIDFDKNPWRYDGQIFISIPLPRDQLIELAYDELSSAKERLELYIRMYNYTRYLCSRKNINYFQRQRELYREIVSSVNNNISAAEYVLKMHGIIC